MEPSKDKFGYFDLFTDPKEYFRLGGHAHMVLTTHAALTVCDMLTERGIFVVGVSGGHWRHPGYEERHDYGWWHFPERDGHMSLQENNEAAKQEIVNDNVEFGADVFLIYEMK
jgi:Colicin-E5 Imm protein